MKICIGLLILFFVTLSSIAQESETFYGKDVWLGKSIQLEVRGSFLISDFTDYATEVFDERLAEVVAFDARSIRAFIVNQGKKRIDIVDISDIDNPGSIGIIDLSRFGKKPLNVAINPKLGSREIAASVQADPVTDPGKIVFFDTDGKFLNSVTVGALPDSIQYTPNGRMLLVANEGETNEEATVNPEGSVSYIDVSKGVTQVTQDDVKNVDFREFNEKKKELARSGVRIFGITGNRPATIAEDLEPESLSISLDSRTAWLTFQENNAIAKINLKQRKVEKIFGLGFKNHRLPDQGLDVSDEDNAINITNWPIKGMYLPDTIAQYRFLGKKYLVTVNEGSGRQEDGFNEVARIKDLKLSEDTFPNASELQLEENLGRLVVTRFPPYGKTTDENGETFKHLFSFGGRSFSIWTIDGKRVFDSGDDMERITAKRFPEDFNSSNKNNDSFDDRSDDRGPEPSGLVVGKVDFGGYSRNFAFIVLERIGGVMVYDITNPNRVRFVDYVNPRDFSGDAEAGTAGDLKPGSVVFVPAKQSPTQQPLVLVANAISGNTRIYELVIK